MDSTSYLKLQKQKHPKKQNVDCWFGDLAKTKNMKTKTKNDHILHSPVLAEEVLEVLQPHMGESYLDLTAGYGGHASLVLEKTGYSKAVLCDRDPEAIEHVRQTFKNDGVRTMHADFSSACDELLSHEQSFDMILADLGVSSPHLDKANRGFSIVRPGPLDMRMNQSEGVTAAELLNSASEAELESILRVYGEEPKARRIAKKIIEQRPLDSTDQLADIVKSVYGGYSKSHPAVRTFQAVRIAVNAELDLLIDMLPKALKLLKPGGRLAIITFHSLEDRIVKQFFKEITDMGYESEFHELTKRPIVPSQTEISFNPRARSAKLRAVVKIKRKD